MSDNSPQNHDQTPMPDDRSGSRPSVAERSPRGRAAAPPARGPPTRSRDLENRVLQLQSSLATMSAQNERLVRTLKEAREQIVTLKAEVDRLAQPPSGYGTVIESYDDGTVDILTGGRKMRVAISPASVDDAAARRARRSCSTRR